MTINLTPDVLQAMLNTALDTGRQNAMNHINPIIGGKPGASHLIVYNTTTGLPNYTAPSTPAVTAQQPAAQQPTGQQPVV